MSTGWKLFEEVNWNGDIFPRSLVHGRYVGAGERSRRYPLDELIRYEFGTPGFNYFEEYEDLVEYLPRFRVRKHRLVACEVNVYDTFSRPESNYCVATKMEIPNSSWYNRKLGLNILCPSILTMDDPGFNPDKVKLITQYDKAIRRRISPP